MLTNCNYVFFPVWSGLQSAQISYIPAGLGLQTPTLTPGGEQRYFEYPLTPQPMPTGQLTRESLLQRSKLHSKGSPRTHTFCSGGNGLDFFQADHMAAQYLQPTSPSPGLPMGVSRSFLSAFAESHSLHHRPRYWHHPIPMDFTVIKSVTNVPLSSSATSTDAFLSLRQHLVDCTLCSCMSAILIPPYSCVLSSDYSAKPCLKKIIKRLFFSTFLCLPLLTPHTHTQTHTHTYIYMLDYHTLFFISLFSTQTSFCRHAYSCCLFVSDFLFLFRWVFGLFLVCACPFLSPSLSTITKTKRTIEQYFCPVVCRLFSLPMWYCVWLVT